MKLNKQELTILIDVLGESTRLTLSESDRSDYYALRVRLEDYLAKITS